MRKKQTKTNVGAVVKNKKKPKFLTTFICIFLAIVIIVGVVLGIVMATKKAKSAVSFDGITIDKGVASYLVSRHKVTYIRFLRDMGVENVEDMVSFWNKDSGEGKTYGELLDEDTRNYIRWIMVTNYIFDSNYKLSAQDKSQISATVNGVLNRVEIGGKEDKFNKMSAKYGFTYSDFKKAAEMLYKTNKINSNGLNLSDADKKSYMENYTHIKLVFIRTESTYEVDEDGNRILSAGGYQMHTYTDAEKAQVAADIAQIRKAISLIGAGVDGAMGETMFNVFLEKYKQNYIASMRDSEYYFHEKETYTKKMQKEYPEIVNKAYEMKIGEYSEVEYDHGVCFIYKYAPSVLALDDSDITESCLYDFNRNATMAFYEKTIPAIGKGVVFNKKFEEIDIIRIPYNSEFKSFD